MTRQEQENPEAIKTDISNYNKRKNCSNQGKR